MSVRLCAAVERLPRLVRRKVAILRAFTVVLLKSFKSCLLFVVALPGLIYTLAQLLALRYMLCLSITWRRRYLTQSYLAWSLALHLFCSVRRSLYGERKYTHAYTNTQAVITWFKSIENKRSSSFIKFDIVEFYPSITKELLTKSINYGKSITTIEGEVITTVFLTRMSLLFDKTSVWVN